MGSLSNAIGMLEGVRRITLLRFCDKIRGVYSKQDVELLLDECPSSEELAEWHSQKVDWVRNQAICIQLDRLCSKVACYLISAADKIIQLELWIMDPMCIEVDSILVGALTDIIVALNEFRVVSKAPVLQAKHNFEMILYYLRQVFRLSMQLARLVCGPNVWDDLSMLWTESLDIADLRSFHFDDMDDYIRSRKQDRSLAGLVSLLNLNTHNSTNIQTDPSP